jgi:hypothetical protein
MDKSSTGLFSVDNRQQRLPPGNRFGAKLHSFSSDDLKAKSLAERSIRTTLQNKTSAGMP